MAHVSAHRAATGADPRAALEAASALGVEYVEIDVQVCADGVLVVRHDDHVRAGGRGRHLRELTSAELRQVDGDLLTLVDALALVGGRAGIHLDLKARSRRGDVGEPVEVRAVRATLDAAPVERVVVTSLSVHSVRVVRDWADAEAPGLLVGLSLGRHVGRRRRTLLLARPGELFPERRLRRSRANLVVAQHRLAGVRIADLADRLHLPLLVWTVDDPDDLRRWLADGRTWLVTTNDPAFALRARDDDS